VVIVAVGVVTWIAIDDEGPGSSSPGGSASATMPGRIGPATAAGAPGRGDPAPDFALPSLDGKGTVRLSDYHGTPVVLNFWASWCTPCRDEFPMLRAAHRDADGRYAVVGVDTKEGLRSDGRSFADDERARWPNGYDAGESVADAYGVGALPQTVFVDADGTIVARVAGPLTEQSLAESLRKLTR
jgi:cytochrome c biogenesis protein CcmG/thiol:disulfide interchange protein DsbE